MQMSVSRRRFSSGGAEIFISSKGKSDSGVWQGHRPPSSARSTGELETPCSSPLPRAPAAFPRSRNRWQPALTAAVPRRTGHPHGLLTEGLPCGSPRV